MLKLKQVTYRIGGRTLLEAADLHLPKGHHAGFVGRNGCGKSTLFKMILGSVHTDAGDLTLTGQMKVATVAQETPGGERTPLEFVLSSHQEMDALLKEAEIGMRRVMLFLASYIGKSVDPVDRSRDTRVRAVYGILLVGPLQVRHR